MKVYKVENASHFPNFKDDLVAERDGSFFHIVMEADFRDEPLVPRASHYFASR
jgi:hypothetical protein